MQSRSFSCVAQAFMMVAVLAFASLANAEPSMQEVNQALKNGNIARADILMKEVLSAHPESAKAHFKYSEILAAEGRVAEAKSELAKAENIQPGLPFAKPEAVSALNRKLFKSQVAEEDRTASSPNPLLKWAGLALLVFFVVAVFKTFRRPAAPSGFTNNSLTPNGAAPQPANGPQTGGLGSSIVGGLATGAAVGAGIVAGEMLMHKVLDGDHNNANTDVAHEPARDFSDISCNEFVDSDNSSWDNDSSLSDSFDSDNSGDWS